MVVLENKFLGAYDAGIGEIPCAVLEAIHFRDSELFLPLLFQYLSIDRFTFVRRQTPDFVDESSVMLDPFFEIELLLALNTEFQRQQIVLVAGLNEITQRTPSVVSWSLHHVCPDGIQIDVGQTVNQGFAVLHDQTLESLSPEEAATFVFLVVVSGESLLDLLHEFGKVAQTAEIL